MHSVLSHREGTVSPTRGSRHSSQDDGQPYAQTHPQRNPAAAVPAPQPPSRTTSSEAARPAR
eukprot:1192995-Prorocentrum_minimum.AAC.1